MNQFTLDQMGQTLPQYGGLQGLTSPQPYMRSDYGRPDGMEQRALGDIASFYRGPTSNPVELQGLNTQRMAADPTMQISAANDIFNKITAPGIQNYYTSVGQGRSGAVGEAMANAGANMALPIRQQSALLQNQYGGSLANYGQLLRGREQENLGGLYGLAQYPRMEDAAAQQPGRDTLLSMLTRFPVSSGAGRSDSTQNIPGVAGGEPPIWQQIMGGVNSAVQIAAMAYGMCWVALALYGPNSPWFQCAFYQANHAKHGWWGRQWRRVYRRYGLRLSVSPTALVVLRPIFYFIARRGARSLGVTLS